jgi:4-hydroxybenzoate polyprenyltransferase
MPRGCAQPGDAEAHAFWPSAALAALRPRQWTKNAVVLAPLFFSLRAREPRAVGLALAAVAIFCLVASAMYLLNDVSDAEQDRAHPLKRARPVASGELSPRLAVTIAVALGAAGLVTALWLGKGFAAFVAAYVVLQLGYSAVLKHIVVLDVFGIAGGFVLRVLAGAEAISVPVSNWLYLCTLLLSLFLALAKRRAESLLLDEGAAQHRRNLSEYSPQLIDQLVSIVCGCTVLAYSLYTLSQDTIDRHGSDRLKYTIPLVIMGVFRYLYLVHRRGGGGEPESILIGDRPLQAVLLAYLAVAYWALYL